MGDPDNFHECASQDSEEEQPTFLDCASVPASAAVLFTQGRDGQGRIGTQAVLQYINSRPRLNGKPCTVESWNADTGRYAVQIIGGMDFASSSQRCMSVLPAKLRTPLPMPKTGRWKRIAVSGDAPAPRCSHTATALGEVQLYCVESPL